MKKPAAVLFLLLFTSALLYLYKFPQIAAFDADQDYYAQQYVQIFQNGKQTLLGIEASVGGVFVAPVYTYFSSIVYALSGGNPIGIFTVTILIAAFQGSLTYLLFAKLKNQRLGIIADLLVVFSHALWQKAFAPSVIGLMYLSGLLFFYYLTTLTKKPKNIIILGLICGTALSLHVSVFAFIPLTIIYLIWKRPKNIKIQNYALALLIFLALASPLLMFDLRHNFFLWKNLFAFLTKGSNNPNISYLENVSRVFSSIFNMFAAFLVPQPFFGKLLIIVGLPYLLFNLKRDENIKTALFIITASFLLFTFYFGNFSDYYFYFLLAPFLFIFASFISAIFSIKPLKIPVVGLLTLIFILNFGAIQKTINPYNYFIKQQVVSYIKSQTGENKTKIYFDNDPGLSVGFNYLFKQASINLSENPKNVYQIIIKGKQTKPGKVFRQEGVENTIRVVKLNIK